MKNILKLEELAMLCISIYALYLFKVDWWCYFLLAAGPDISMLGYVAGNRTGAFFYNLFHHKAIAIIVYLIGVWQGSEVMEVAGIILFGHSSLDRTLGYGLKLKEGFKHTHLGIIGNKE